MIAIIADVYNCTDICTLHKCTACTICCLLVVVKYMPILFYRETAVTQVTFSEPTENNVRLLNTSVMSSVTAYENLDFDDDNDDVDHSDFMTKENFDAKKKRLSSIKKWSSSNKGVLEITPDPEIV